MRLIVPEGVVKLCWDGLNGSFWDCVHRPMRILIFGQCCFSFQSQAPAEEDDEGDEEETEELGQTETYAEYIPSKCECLGTTWAWEGLLTPLWTSLISCSLIFMRAECALCHGPSQARDIVGKLHQRTVLCWCYAN